MLYMHLYTSKTTQKQSHYKHIKLELFIELSFKKYYSWYLVPNFHKSFYFIFCKFLQGHNGDFH